MRRTIGTAEERLKSAEVAYNIEKARSDQMRREIVVLKTYSTGHPSEHRPREDRQKSIFNTRDYKVPLMAEGCTTEQFKQWRHDVLIYLEAHENWRGAKKVLDLVRREKVEISAAIMATIIRSANKDHAKVRDPDDTNYGELIPDGTWKFGSRARELYQLISVKLSSSAFADYKDEDGMNGFEMWRVLNKAKGPLREYGISSRVGHPANGAHSRSVV